MEITFLEAERPLRKKFGRNGKTNYPHVLNFTSHTQHIDLLSDFHNALLHRAQLGHCLLKGVVTRPLTDEPRAGTTNRDALTTWIALDADRLSSVSDANSFLTRMALAGTSYVQQWSSSAFLEHEDQVDTRFNAHIFMFLDQPVSPHRLKLWLKKQNFDHFQDDLELTASGMALRWGLDITTCQNDKLLYIAPPKVTPPYRDTLTLDERISYHEAPHARLDVEKLELDKLDADELRKQEIDIINRLRVDRGLDKKRATAFVAKGKNVEYLANPDQAKITETKEERGFVYFNLNGGDSWAYYHPADNYEYIHNFKGEPVYRTEELLPGYYRARRQEEGLEKSGGRTPVAFRGMQDGCIYNGFFDEGKNEVELYMARRPADALLFMAQYGVDMEALPTYRLLHDPHCTGPRVDKEREQVNLFQLSDLERNHTIDGNPTPVIDKLLDHVFGPSNVQHFLNWFAFIVQHKTASGTAWVAHGCQGTGKGVLFHNVLRPILGERNARQVRTANFEDNYNGFLENALLINIDEVDVPESRRDKMIMADLKNYITEKTISIRKMHSNVYEIVNRCNFLFSSNKRSPIPVEATDRRMNIADEQENPISLTTEEIEQIADELPAFLHQMLMLPVDSRAARTAAITSAKLEMQALSETSVDQIAQALLKGKAEVLHGFCDNPDDILDIDQKILAQRYNRIVRDIIVDGKDKLTRNELRTLFEATVGRVPDSPAKFTKYLRHHGIRVGLHRIGNVVERGAFCVTWRDSSEWLARARREYGVMKTVDTQDDKTDEKEKDSGRQAV